MHSLNFQTNQSERFRLLARRIAAGLLFYSGFDACYRFLMGGNRPIILMYHRVIGHAELTATYLQPGMYVTEKTFELQMEYVSRHYNVIRMEEFIDKVRKRNTIRKNTCVITFDDGWKDTYVHAYPILIRYRIPATIFLTTSYIGTHHWFWPERLCYLFMHRCSKQQGLNVSMNSNGMINQIFSAICSTLREDVKHNNEVIDGLIGKLKSFPVEAIDEVLDQIYRILDISQPTEGLLLNWSEVEKMSRNGITFGSHTCTHRILTGLPLTKVKRELEDSLTVLKEKQINYIPIVSYPNGDYNREIEEVVRDCGYKAAVTTSFGHASKLPQDLFEIKRIGIHDDISWALPLFSWRISGLEDALRVGMRK